MATALNTISRHQDLSWSSPNSCSSFWEPQSDIPDKSSDKSDCVNISWKYQHPWQGRPTQVLSNPQVSKSHRRSERNTERTPIPKFRTLSFSTWNPESSFSSQLVFFPYWSFELDWGLHGGQIHLSPSVILVPCSFLFPQQKSKRNNNNNKFPSLSEEEEKEKGEEELAFGKLNIPFRVSHIIWE